MNKRLLTYLLTYLTATRATRAQGRRHSADWGGHFL